MKFSKWVFTIAGIYGVLVIAPLYFMENAIAQSDPPAITHPLFFYGFAGVGLAWQLAFLVIGRAPARLRSMMPIAVLEKVSFAGAAIALYAQKRMNSKTDLGLACVDLLWALLFLVAFAKTGRAAVAEDK